jgi:uncharacterized membrane protein
MNESRKPVPRAAGILITLGTLGGAVYGAVKGQPSLGLVLGFGAGVAIALAFWLFDRRNDQG